MGHWNVKVGFLACSAALKWQKMQLCSIVVYTHVCLNHCCHLTKLNMKLVCLFLCVISMSVLWKTSADGHSASKRSRVCTWCVWLRGSYIMLSDEIKWGSYISSPAVQLCNCPLLSWADFPCLCVVLHCVRCRYWTQAECGASSNQFICSEIDFETYACEKM